LIIGEDSGDVARSGIVGCGGRFKREKRLKDCIKIERGQRGQIGRNGGLQIDSVLTGILHEGINSDEDRT
jgi:hypothetical protein